MILEYIYCRIGTYNSIWLKESYREDGKVKSRYIHNLKDWSEEAINALQIALDSQNKSNPTPENKPVPDKPEIMQVSPQ